MFLLICSLTFSGDFAAPATFKSRLDSGSDDEDDGPEPAFWILGDKIPKGADLRQVKILEQLRLFQVY